MLTRFRGVVTAVVMAGALLAPVVAATDAVAASRARHSAGVCKANAAQSQARVHQAPPITDREGPGPDQESSGVDREKESS